MLVAAFLGDHVHHQASLRVFAPSTSSAAACSLHTFAEVFAVLSSLPIRPPISPEQAGLFVAEVYKHGSGRRRTRRCGRAYLRRAAAAVRQKVRSGSHIYVEPQALSCDRAGSRKALADALGGFCRFGVSAYLKRVEKKEVPRCARDDNLKLTPKAVRWCIDRRLSI